MNLLLPMLMLAAAGGRAEVVVPAQSWSVEGAGVQVDGPWWAAFDDGELDRVVSQALDSNLDLESATRRVAQARHLARQAGAPLLPWVSFDTSTSLQPCDSLGFSPCQFAVDPGTEVPDTFTSGRVGMNATWSVDVWGGTINSVNAGRLEALAAEGDQQALALLVSTRTAEAWFDVGFAGRQLEVVAGQVERSEDLLAIVSLRHERSEATALDVLQQQQQLAATQAQMPGARTAFRVAQQQLAILLGESPVDASFTGSLPEVSGLPDLGSPVDLLETRPDLQASLARVNAALAGERATAKTMLPSPALSAGYNRSFQTVDETESLDTWNAGLVVSVPLFVGGGGASALGAARANTDALTLSANQAVLSAMAEVEGALVRDQEAAVRLQATGVQLEAATLAFGEARSRYAEGLGNYLELLTALQALQTAQLTRLSAHRDQLSARVALHAALGWKE